MVAHETFISTFAKVSNETNQNKLYEEKFSIRAVTQYLHYCSSWWIDD